MKSNTKQFIRLIIGVFLVHVSGAINYAINMEVGFPWWANLVWGPIFALGFFFILWFTKERHTIKKGRKGK